MKVKDVRGKVFLVTGGAMGMGKLVAERFARDGAKVVIWDMNEGALAKTAKEFGDKGYEVYTSVVDVSDREKVYQEAEKVKKEVGSVDVLMNNAGIVRGARSWIPKTRTTSTRLTSTSSRRCGPARRSSPTWLHATTGT